MTLAGNRIGKITLTVSFLFFGMSCSTLAQQPVEERTITVNMEATEQLPANLIIFNIDVNAEGDTPQEAFELHRERESILAGLLKELNIKDEDIDYDPVRMHRRQVNGNRFNNNDEPKHVVVTNQSVSITFEDFALYEKIQLSLIENGFNSFNGRFSSTKIDEGKEKALVSAIEAAKERARLIAETSGNKLGAVFSVNHSDHHISIPAEAQEMQVMSRSADSSLMNFSQFVEVSANINISYYIE